LPDIKIQHNLGGSFVINIAIDFSTINCQH
jgi:hypothetical protein